MKKSLEPGLFLIKKENMRLKKENSKLKARVENIENKLSEAKLFELLFPVVVASMLTVWMEKFIGEHTAEPKPIIPFPMLKFS